MAEREPTGADGETAREATGGWRPDGTAEVVVSGYDPQETLLSGLHALLALATATPGADRLPDQTAAPIQGSGADLAALFAELSADLLDQLAALGRGFNDVRLDGLLETDDGGYSAWGYLLGEDDAGAVVPVALDGAPVVAQARDGDRLTLRFTIRRQAGAGA